MPMDLATKELAPDEITRVAVRLQRAYPYIRARKELEGVLADTPLEALVRAMLSQHTTDVNRDRAFDALRARYADWEAVMNAPLDELNEVIRVTNYSFTKAGRIQHPSEACRRSRER